MENYPVGRPREVVSFPTSYTGGRQSEGVQRWVVRKRECPARCLLVPLLGDPRIVGVVGPTMKRQRSPVIPGPGRLHETRRFRPQGLISRGVESLQPPALPVKWRLLRMRVGTTKDFISPVVEPDPQPREQPEQRPGEPRQKSGRAGEGDGHGLHRITARRWAAFRNRW